MVARTTRLDTASLLWAVSLLVDTLERLPVEGSDKFSQLDPFVQREVVQAREQTATLLLTTVQSLHRRIVPKEKA